MRIDVNGTIVSNDDSWIYDFYEIENTSPKTIKDKISQAKGDKLDIYINSGGGDLFAGLEMYSELREYQGQVKIHVQSVAGSAASIIAMAGKSEISPTAQLMIHNVSGTFGGDYHDMDKASEILQGLNKSISQAYIAKTGKSEKDILAMLDKETWLTAQEAVKQGFIDEISTSKNLQIAASATGLLPLEVINKMRNQRAEKANADFFMAKNKAQTKLNLLKLGGKNID
jgi:ATP-dependent protease ClpP protease subunit